MPEPEKALDIVRELSHVLYWAGRTYLRDGAESLRGKTFDESLVPKGRAGWRDCQRRRAGHPERPSSMRRRRPARGSRASWKRCASGLPPSRRRTRQSPSTRELIIDLDLHRAGWPLDHLKSLSFVWCFLVLQPETT